MNKRQYKKLCKKSAEIIGFDKCCNDEDFWLVFTSVDQYGECDSYEAWDFIVERFHGDVNTIADENSECGINWKPDNEFTKATPANVFDWARKQEWK